MTKTTIPTPKWDTLNRELNRAARLIKAALDSGHWIIHRDELKLNEPTPIRRQREEIAAGIYRMATGTPPIAFDDLPDDDEQFNPALDCAMEVPA